MDILNKMKPPGSAVWYSEPFRSTVEDNLSWLRASSNTLSLEVPETKQQEFRYNLYGFLMSENINPRYHWIVLRVNGWISPQEFDDVTEVTVPSMSDIDLLYQRHKSIL